MNSGYTFFRDRSEWADITPLKQDESERGIVRIAYSDAFIDAHDYVRAVMAVDEMSPRALALTAEVLQMNAANYSVWEYRRRLLLSTNAILTDENHFAKSFLYEHPKNYQLWYHLQWLMEQQFKEQSPKMVFQQPNSTLYKLVSRDLDLIEEILQDDAKNYHAWQYRRWLADFFSIPTDFEINFCKRMLDDDVLNNSAWNHRFYTVLQEGLLGEVFEREFRYVTDCLRQWPKNESACNYLFGIISPLPAFKRTRNGELTAADTIPSLDNLVRLREFIEELISDDNSDAADSPALLSLLVEAYSDLLRLSLAKRRKKKISYTFTDQSEITLFIEKIVDNCNRLASELDRVRVNYWIYRSNQAKNFSVVLPTTS